MNDWWCPEDASLFQAKCDVMAKQTWTFLEPATGKTHTMNPKLCMGENLADLGGISLAVQALNRRIEKRIGEDSARRSALYRIFFYNWAVVWKAKLTDDAIVSRIATDPHAPAPFRGNLVQNIDQFYDAFEVKPGDGMFLAPQDRVVMW
ncbi:peptidase family M13 [Obelidium mucronatum]|nr:peptidase family M13 [Obelidium mucronatum]